MLLFYNLQHCFQQALATGREWNPSQEIPYSLIFLRIKYVAVWLNSAQKQIFTDKIFVVECELCKATPTQLLVRTTITLDSGPVGHGSLHVPSAHLKYCNRDIL